MDDTVMGDLCWGNLATALCRSVFVAGIVKGREISPTHRAGRYRQTLHMDNISQFNRDNCGDRNLLRVGSHLRSGILHRFCL